MNKLLIIVLPFIILISTNSILFSERTENITSEIRFTNRTSTSIFIKCYPVSLVFDGNRNYSILSKNRWNSITSNFRFDYNNGVSLIRNLPDTTRIKKNVFKLWGGEVNSINFQFDLNDNDENYCSLGFGKYKIIFASDEELTEVIDTLTIEYDWGYGSYFDPDIIFYYNLNGKVSFHWGASTERYIDATDVNKKIECWNQYEEGMRAKDLGNFTYNSSNGNNYTIIPQDSRRDCNILTGVQEQNHEFDDNRSGYLTLNLTIEKNITTREFLVDTITNIVLPTHGYLKINSGKIFNMIAPTSPVGGSNNLIVQDSSSLFMETYSHLIVGSGNKLTLKSKGVIDFLSPSENPYENPNGAKITIESGALFCNEGGRINNGSITYEKGYNHHLLCATAQDVVYSDSTKIILSDSAVMEIPDGVIMHFSGIKSGLIMKPNSKLMLGVGCKIIFDSLATLIANGATFTSIDSTLKWDGIVLSNSDADTITNCTFSNAVTALTITNDANTAYKNRIITNNTFNIPSGGICKGIYGENNYKILLKGNTFNMPVYFPSASPVPLIYVGVYLKNSSTIEAAGGDIEEDQGTNYSLNILENTFSNGCASVILANYTSNYLPYIINDNIFNNTASVNIIGMNITGTIRDNTFTSDDVPLGIHLINSSPNLYKNTIYSRDVGLHLAGHCYPNLAPYVSGEDLVWTGGNNYITTTDIDNIQLSSSGYVNTDFGNNNFIADNSSSYHIYGWLDSAHSIYKTRDNCWNGSAQSRIYLKTYGSADTVPVPVINTNNYSCTGEISPAGWNVTYNGNGIYDSVKLTDDYTGEEQSEADIIYAQALADYNNNFDVQAITDFKYLIDNYPDIEKLPEILYEFYMCYQSLDTNEGQNYREPLYQDIIDYLNDKILSDEYKENEEFSDNAYDIILMAQSIIDLNAAAGGYEFLAFNHPDPNIRLTASWNYAEIEELINSGNGGGQLGIENYELGIEELRELKEIQRMDELVSEDPLMSKMKKSFEKTSNEKKERIDKQISRESKSGEIVNEKIIRSRQIDLQKEDRAKRNVFELRNMSKKEKEMRRMEDLALTTMVIRNENNREEKVNIPLQYRLEQNYPNPFNPTTHLEFGISKLGFVSLKVFDVLGKEVKTLVSEIKPAGFYEVEFDGSNLASGIYFYKLESGNFIQTKRMILLK